LNRYSLLQVGFFTLIVADFVLAFAPNIWVLLGGVGIWGIQMGISQNIFLTLVDQTVPADLRGTAFGFFYLISAIAIIVAGTAAGNIAQHFSFGGTFLASGCVGTGALLLLMVIPKAKKKEATV
jgi:predicted MFS family arabinose efflux permease